MLLVLLLAPACGDSSGDDDDAPDAAAGGADAGADAGTTGLVADFDECTGDADCAGANSDCRMVGWTQRKECLPACEATSECGFNTYCYPDNASTVLGANFAFMAGHCWFSICGPGRQNGETGGACQLGAEAALPAAQQLPGYCLAIEDGLFGQCLEAGDVAAGGTCDFGTPVRGGNNCDGASLCVGQTGAPSGTCAATCDPRKLLTGVDECADPAQDCFDQSSLITYSDGSTARSTVAFCAAVQACTVIGPSPCPAGEGCAFSNPPRATGRCDPTATGHLTPGHACGGTGDAVECQAGSACLGTCLTLCDLPAPRPGQLGGACVAATDCKQIGTTCTGNVCVQACGGAMDFDCPEPTTCQGGFCTRPAARTVDCNAATAGTSCQPVRWENGSDMTAGTADDVYAADWGVCDVP